MENEFAIIGMGKVGKAACIAGQELARRLVILNHNGNGFVEINNIKYRERVKRQTHPLIGLIIKEYNQHHSRKRPVINLVEEFKLIQNKKSKLSKNDRDWAVRQFENQFERID